MTFKAVMCAVLASSIATTSFAQVNVNSQIDTNVNSQDQIQLNNIEVSPLIERLRELPPEETLKVLKDAQLNLKELQGYMIEAQNDLLGAIEEQKEREQSIKGKVYRVTVGAWWVGLAGAGVTSAWNLLRNIYQLDSSFEGSYALTQQFVRRSKEAAFFWSSMALMAISAVATEFLAPIPVELEEKEFKALQETVETVQDRIQHEEQLIRTLQATFRVKVKTQDTIQNQRDYIIESERVEPDQN